MGKKGQVVLAFLSNPYFWAILVIIFGAIFLVVKLTYVPKHCIAYSEEVKQALLVKSIEISKIEKSSN